MILLDIIVHDDGENWIFGTPNVVLRTFAIPNVDIAKIGIEMLLSYVAIRCISFVF